MELRFLVVSNRSKTGGDEGYYEALVSELSRRSALEVTGTTPHLSEEVVWGVEGGMVVLKASQTVQLGGEYLG